MPDNNISNISKNILKQIKETSVKTTFNTKQQLDNIKNVVSDAIETPSTEKLLVREIKKQKLNAIKNFKLIKINPNKYLKKYLIDPIVKFFNHIVKEILKVLQFISQQAAKLPNQNNNIDFTR